MISTSSRRRRSAPSWRAWGVGIIPLLLSTSCAPALPGASSTPSGMKAAGDAPALSTRALSSVAEFDETTGGVWFAQAKEGSSSSEGSDAGASILASGSLSLTFLGGEQLDDASVVLY